MYACSSYYFSSEGGNDGSADVFEGVKLAYTKHFGSIALGSLIQTIIKIVRTIADAADNDGKGEGDGAAKVVAVCLKCLLNCIEDFLNYLNILAYANMAISGDKYCTSAWNGFMLNLRHIG